VKGKAITGGKKRKGTAGSDSTGQLGSFAVREGIRKNLDAEELSSRGP